MIYVIGDSHDNLFKDPVPVPGFQTYHAGSNLAYSIGTPDHPVRKEVARIILELPDGGNVMPVFGEIDCRRHLVKQKMLQAKPIELVVKECVDLYFKGCLEVFEGRRRDLVFWGPHPTWEIVVGESGYHPHPGWKQFGTYEEVNYAKMLFNLYLQELCRLDNIPFATVYFDMMARGWGIDKVYHFNDTHLGPRMLPMAVKKLSEAGIDVSEAQAFLEAEKGSKVYDL